MNFFDNRWLNPKDPRTYYIRVKQLAKCVVPDNATSRDPYWDRMGQVFVEMVILSEKELAPNKLNIGRIARSAFELSGRDDLRFVMVEPFGGKDWNKILQLQNQPPAPSKTRVSKLDVG